MKDRSFFIPLDAEEIGAQHVSDVVFPDLDDDVRPFATEWEASAGFLTMACGCKVEVFVGDTVWFLPGDDPDSLIPIAIDPATIH